MSDYYADPRSNYFKVKDLNKFKKFCDEFSLRLIKKESRVGFLSETEFGNIPYQIYDEETDDFIDAAFN